MKKCYSIIAASAFALSIEAVTAADVTGTVTFKGAPPPEIEITAIKDNADCGKMHTTMPTTHHYVVGANGGLANVVVFLEGPSIAGKSTGESAAPVVLDQHGCEYSPQIFAVQTGQKIMVKNSDPVPHNVHDKPAVEGNKEMNNLQMPGSAPLAFSFSKPEMFLKFQCDVHPWMFSWVSVFDHPYFAVTATDGSFKIANVPAGKYTIHAEHRKAGTAAQEIEVGGGQAPNVPFTLGPPQKLGVK